MIRILFLIDKLSRGGSQSNLLEIIRGLDRRKFSPHVIALVEGGRLVPEFKAAGAEPIELHVERAYDASAFGALSFLIRYMRQLKIDIVQTHFLHADILGTIAGTLAGVPRIITTRRDEGFWRGFRQRAANRFLNLFCSRILVNSEAVKRAVIEEERAKPGKIFVIHNVVDTKRFYPSDDLRTETRKNLGIRDEEVVIGVLANMRHEVKGHTFLIEAIPMILKEAPHVKFLFVGEGTLRGRLENYAANLGVRKAIHFLGSRPDVNDLINAMDISCLPSLSEGFSNSILESMAIGVPVVATAVGGNTEIIQDGKTGVLVPSRNASALAAKLLALVHDKELRTKLGGAGRQKIHSQFRIEQMAAKYEEFYRKPPVKLLYLICSLDLGGAEQIVVDLVRKINRNLYEPVVCCLNDRGRYAPRVEAEGVRVITLYKRPQFDPFLIPRLVRLIGKEKIGLIHTHLFGANFWGRVAAFLTGTPVVSSEHGMDLWRTRLHLGLDRLLTPINKKVIFVSEGVRSFYAKRNPRLNGKGTVLHSGIDITDFEQGPDRTALRKRLGLAATDKVVGIVGRLVPEKAHVDFIEAIQFLKEEGQAVKGLIVGEGHLLEALRARVQEARLEDRILFAGYQSDVKDFYRAMDVLVMCSLREGFPLTVLEAMAAGVPVVATRVGGIPECIEDGVDGCLASPGDSVALAEAVSKILTDTRFKEAIVAQAKAKVRAKFNVEKMVREHESIYEEVLAP